MKSVSRRSVVALGATALLAGISRRAKAAGKYGPGFSDAEIKLGTTAYYSGPASTAAAYGLAQVAYFQMVNDRGGINGRRLT
jgi:branched-chain amino acid transport system substrate-binding protein